MCLAGGQDCGRAGKKSKHSQLDANCQGETGNHGDAGRNTPKQSLAQRPEVFD